MKIRSWRSSLWSPPLTELCCATLSMVYSCVSLVGGECERVVVVDSTLILLQWEKLCLLVCTIALSKLNVGTEMGLNFPGDTTYWMGKENIQVISLYAHEKILKHLLFRLNSVGVSTARLDSIFLSGSTISVFAILFFYIWTSIDFFYFVGTGTFWLDSQVCVLFLQCYIFGWVWMFGTQGVYEFNARKMFLWCGILLDGVSEGFPFIFWPSMMIIFLGHILGNEHTVY